MKTEEAVSLRDDPATLAYHWTQAQVWDRAVECHWLAGERAGSVYAHAEAADHYTQALHEANVQLRQLDQTRRQ